MSYLTAPLFTQPEKVTGSSHDGQTGSKIPEEMMEMTDTEFIAPVFIQGFNLRAVVEVILHDYTCMEHPGFL